MPKIFYPSSFSYSSKVYIVMLLTAKLIGEECYVQYCVCGRAKCYKLLMLIRERVNFPEKPSLYVLENTLGESTDVRRLEIQCNFHV
jgi:hypothetical protein